MVFTDDELILMILYNPGTREGLILELTEMKNSLTNKDKNLCKWIKSVLEKLTIMSDSQYNDLNLHW